MFASVRWLIMSNVKIMSDETKSHEKLPELTDNDGLDMYRSKYV